MKNKIREYTFGIIFLIFPFTLLSSDLVEVKKRIINNSDCTHPSYICKDTAYYIKHTDYYINNPNKMTDSLQIRLIEELLNLQGNEKPDMVKVNITSCDVCSTLYTGDRLDVTIQMTALFKIEKLLLKRINKKGIPYSVIRNKEENYLLYGDEEEFKKIYKLYWDWFKVLKEKGFDYIIKNNINALDNTKYSWY